MFQNDSLSDGCPAIFQSIGTGEELVRVEIHSPALTEAQVQDLLRLHPKLLPVSELASNCAPCRCIGREVSAGTGRLDNLYISPTGNLTLVETKLWKNPEARREVVGQIVEYARHMADWEYGRLEEEAKKHLQEFHDWNGGLYEWLETQFAETILPEQRFIDTVNESLTAGRFLLLIVGDGIRQGVGGMVEYLQSAPQLRFKFALVELQCFRHAGEDWPLVIVPKVVAKTAEIERAVVHIDLTDAAKKQIQVTTNVSPDSVTGKKTGGRVNLDREAFFENLGSFVDTKTVGAVKDFAEKVEDEIAGVQVIIQQRMLFDWDPGDPDSDFACRLLAVDYHGWLTAGGRNANAPTPPELEEYWRRLGSIHPELRPQKRPQGGITRKRIQLTQLAGSFDLIFDAMAEYAQACQVKD